MTMPLVAGNWKMNGRRESVGELLEALVGGLAAQRPEALPEVAVIPAFLHLGLARDILDQGSKPGSGMQASIALGAQDVAQEGDDGAHTGEVSAAMLADMGCQYVLVGHSERRSLYAETDDTVAAKLAQVVRAGLTPILCVGESLEARERGEAEAVIGAQLEGLRRLETLSSLAAVVIAYEPIWAIGTGRTATPAQANAVHEYIHRHLGTSPGAADAPRVLYGGSVKGGNAAELFAEAAVDGGLIGGASLKSEEFLRICQAATT